MRVNIQYCTIKLSMPWRQREILALVVVARGRLNVYDNGRGGVGLRRHVHGHDSEHGVTVRQENEQQAAQRRCRASHGSNKNSRSSPGRDRNLSMTCACLQPPASILKCTIQCTGTCPRAAVFFLQAFSCSVTGGIRKACVHECEGCGLLLRS